MAYSKAEQVDTVDLAAVIIAPLLAAMVFGVFSLSVSVFGIGSFLTDPLWTSGSTTVTFAAVGAVAGIGWVLATNEMGDGSYETSELAAIGVSLALVPAYVFIPAINTFVASNDVVALVATLAFTASLTVISYVK